MANSKLEPRWVGEKTLTQRPDSPEIEYGTDEWTITRRWEGPWEACKAARLHKGEKMKLDGSWTYVHTSRVTRLEGGRGLLTIVAKRRAEISGDPEPDESDPTEDNKDSDLGDYQNKAPIIEVEWMRIDKPISTAPIFAALTNEDWGNIKAWEAGETNRPDCYGAFQYQHNGDGNWRTLSGLALKYAEKIRRGQTHWMAFTPVVRSTHYYSRSPNTASCGRKSSPPAGPSGYEWVKTADRAVRQEGQWTRMQEWTGADEWDDDLYG